MQPNQTIQSAVRNEIKEMLGAGICEIKFKKADGEERTMLATLQQQHILPDQRPKETDKKADKKPENEETIVCWDMQKDAWRSFRLDRLIAYKLVA